MFRITALILISISMQTQTLFDFSKKTPRNSWTIVDDVVMGGRSEGHFAINSDGYGAFSGTVSLENNGGFSSVRHRLEPITIKQATKIRIRLKGDGNAYQFRIKHSSQTYYSYTCSFETNGEWEEVVLPFKDFYPVFRGRELDLPNFDQEQIEELTFLIANKKPQSFRLVIDRIELE
ncbi:CIA30 family protein [Robiginitalea sp. IMCC43444]|uniref:CIA30 family protein n=1 Tax=Robiginitalea sp. IMCC43444 TaxID=3459121 RepID=UPI004042AA93